MQLIKACVGRARVKNVIFHKAAAPRAMCAGPLIAPLGIARFSHSEMYAHMCIKRGRCLCTLFHFNNAERAGLICELIASRRAEQRNFIICARGNETAFNYCIKMHNLALCGVRVLWLKKQHIEWLDAVNVV
jgi:hypothetical protein